MDYWFYNTDAKSMGGQRRFPILVENGFAATSGPRSFGEQLGNLSPRDTLLMYENRVGVVAVGTVLERWDEKNHTSPLYYLPGDDGFDHEYRIKVNWFLDLSENPITVDELKSHNTSTPRGAVRKIVKRRPEIESMIAEYGSAIAKTHDTTAITAPERIETTTHTIIRDTALARLVKVLHDFKCQICGHTIESLDGTRYAEAHHIRPLGAPHNGPDVIGNILCVCPNHHVELDYGVSPLSLPVLHASKAHPVDPQYIGYHNEVIYNRKTNDVHAP